MTTIEEHQRGNVTVIEIIGDLDALNEHRMMAKVDQIIRAGKIRIVLDLTQMQLIDSSGVGTLVSLFKRARLMKGDAKLCGLKGQPLEIFKLLRLDKAFDTYSSVDAAIKAFGTAAGSKA